MFYDHYDTLHEDPAHKQWPSACNENCRSLSSHGHLCVYVKKDSSNVMAIKSLVLSLKDVLLLCKIVDESFIMMNLLKDTGQ